MFRGLLYAGSLFKPKLFGLDEEITPQVEIPLEYHGSGRASEEADLVARVLDKWRVIESGKPKLTKKARSGKPSPTKVVEVPVVLEPAANVPDLGTTVPDLGPFPEAVEALTPFIQPTFVLEKQPLQDAPTKSAPASVTIVLDDGMEDAMAMLLALEEAGEL
jgi:hypothetical protein